MRVLLLLLVAACGEAETVLLLDASAALPKPPPPPSPIDAGVVFDAGPKRPAADIVPSIMEFGPIPYGTTQFRTLMAVNRNNEETLVIVLTDTDSFDYVPAEVVVPAKTRREIHVQFVPAAPGVSDEILEIDACGAGCITRVRLVGTAG